MKGTAWMSVTIREARKTSEDVDAMSAMTVALHRLHEACDPRCSRLRDAAADLYRREVLEWLDDADTRILLAEDEAGEVVGMAIGRIERRPGRVPEVSGQIRRVFVKERCRRRGAARMMLKDQCDFFVSGDVGDVSLHYLIRNGLAERFWTRLGFEPLLINVRTTLDDLRDRL